MTRPRRYNNNLFWVRAAAAEAAAAEAGSSVRALGVQQQSHWTNHITVIGVYAFHRFVNHRPSHSFVRYFDGFQDGSMTNRRENEPTSERSVFPRDGEKRTKFEIRMTSTD